MDEKGKYLLSLGSGALLGSAATLATSKLLLRQSGKECANVDFIDSNETPPTKPRITLRFSASISKALILLGCLHRAPSATVVVKGLPQKTTEEDLYQILAEWGPIHHIRVIKGRRSGISRGFAFFDFPSVGFVAAITHLRSFVPVIYNMTVAIPKNEPQPTLLRLFRGRSSTVHVHIERHLMQELPETNSRIAQWCKDVFVAKDAFLELHLAMSTFGNDIRRDIGRPKRSLLVVIYWSCLLLLPIVKFFEMYPFSWGEVASCVIADLNLCIPAKRPTKEVDDGLIDVPTFVND
ncbi:1-acyl-sn-glycerol-3-phosphate acyltransferase [Orobanche hederae]